MQILKPGQFPTTFLSLAFCSFFCCQSLVASDCCNYLLLDDVSENRDIHPIQVRYSTEYMPPYLYVESHAPPYYMATISIGNCNIYAATQQKFQYLSDHREISVATSVPPPCPGQQTWVLWEIRRIRGSPCLQVVTWWGCFWIQRWWWLRTQVTKIFWLEI